MSALSVAILLAQASPAAAAPPAATCAGPFARAVAGNGGEEVPSACWRMGPLTLGMRENAVERTIGPPVAAAEVGSRQRYRATLHVFPSASGSTGVVPKLRLVELRYANGGLVAIDAAPGAKTDSEPCAGRPARVRAGEVVTDAPVGPLVSFNGVRLGDPASVIARRFGRAPAANASRDWFNYLPVPVSFDVDPDRRRVAGFAIATDEEALTTAALPLVHLERDRTTCRLAAIHYGLEGR